VSDRWEVRWNARQAISVAAMASDGTIVAGSSGVLRGSLFVPAGGSYYLKITDGTVGPPGPATSAAPAPGTNAAPAINTNAPPVIVPDIARPAAPEMSWHLQVMQLAPTVASTETLTVYTPYFSVPDSAITPVTPPPEPPTPTLTQDQLRAMVAIKGDNAQGNGFLVRSPDGVFVACHLSLLADNPNLAIYSSAGATLPIVSAKAATDRDLALLAVQDDHFSTLPLPGKDDDAAAPGDEVLIPAVGESDALGGKPGKIVDFGADRVDFDAAVDASSVGAPVIRVKSGAALALVTAEKKIDLSERIAKAWPGNPAPGSATIIPNYGLPLKDVAGWEPLDLGRFADESAFLQNFHDTTRSLDSYLNGRVREQFNPPDGDGPPSSQYYLKNAQIKAAAATYKKSAVGADLGQGLDASRELLADLQMVADTDVDRLQTASSAYAFNRRRVQEELAYRKAIKAELSDLGDNIQRLNVIGLSR
jgi:hypothetical protein